MELKEKVKNLRALVVEDDDSTADLMQRLVSRNGFQQTDLAIDEPTALELLSQNKYDFILSDTNYGSPSNKDYYGARIVAAARKSGQNPKVIAMSGLDTNGDIWVGESRADLFLRKPFGPSELKAALEKIYQI